MCAVDDDVEAALRRIAFAIGRYAASRVYDRLFALHGWDASQRRIRAAAKEGDPAGMADAVPGEAVDMIGIACRPADLPARAAEHAASFGHLNLCAAPSDWSPRRWRRRPVASSPR